ncbi:multiple inositol polyphosphate phosphatase 1 isoform X3 [Hyalella azteca]|uniref:Multiple inositol polyphosphate phosphatase 1 n=1 Tax=Hyalella azteca TaxID=294128 RepID=A0A8B7PDF5_HYAAZ|nr:multiple inositol polyphosphate phosphatase 1 isoform X2 [Hyalella azteca]XP_047741535.1 multiple inositol polyphosphate phosphatase 1 isoform X3 [Hyalella azteca]
MNVLSFVTAVTLLSFYTLANAARAQKFCLDQTVSKSHFATRTSYVNAFEAYNFSKPDVPPFIGKWSDTCSVEAQQLWLITRHGIRYPLQNEMQRLLATLPIIAQELIFNHKEGRGCLSDAEAEILEKFTPPFSKRDVGQLAEAGAEEQFMLGQFWKNLFPHLFEEPYSRDIYEVEFTVANRTGQSAYHFLRGAFGEDVVANNPLPKPHSPNFKLRPYKTCPAWQADVLKSKTTLREQKLYEMEPEFLAMMRSVSERLGYVETMSVDDLLAVYAECRYETAWWPVRESVWCRAFSERDILVLEYHQALRYYYEQAYGGPALNYEMACSTVSDLLKQIRDRISGSSQRKASLYFSHDKELLFLYTALGLYRPSSPLTHDSRSAHIGGPFAISSLVPFSSNLAFVLYSCNDGAYRVGGFHLGKPLSLSPLCPDDTSGTCSWPILKIEDIAQSCNIRTLCRQRDEL